MGFGRPPVVTEGQAGTGWGEFSLEPRLEVLWAWGGSADSWLASHLTGKFCGWGGAFFPEVVGQPGQSPRFQGQLCARPEEAGSGGTPVPFVLPPLQPK